MTVEPEKHEDGLDEDGEAGEVGSISPPGDNLDDVSCSKFQYHSLTQTIFEMTQFKMPCGTYDPL